MRQEVYFKGKEMHNEISDYVKSVNEYQLNQGVVYKPSMIESAKVQILKYKKFNLKMKLLKSRYEIKRCVSIAL